MPYRVDNLYIMNPIIGRTKEQKILLLKKKSPKAELIAVIGRRRIGKTFLIRNFFSKDVRFELTGMHDATLKIQLQNFALALQKATNNPIQPASPANWLEAFNILDSYIDVLSVTEPAVIFFDEFPWLHTPKSNFLEAFDHWWNSSASKRNNLKVVICGSAASWMIDKVVEAKGGLHNRVTQTIRLEPFNLKETEDYLNSLGVILDRYAILQLYMATGGVPHYLQHIAPGESAAQCIDRICFSKDGPLTREFTFLFNSLFDNSSQHELIVRSLAKNGSGLTRQEIIKITKLSSGGRTTRILKELVESGFISPYIPYQKTANDAIYKLSDEYSLFYLKFIEGGAGAWLPQFLTQSYNSWSGFAFETVCQKHIQQIKKSLKIMEIPTNISAWRYTVPKGSKMKGAQIDLLLDRKDNIINLCEIKFSKDSFTIDKDYAEDIDRKLKIFKQQTKTRSTIFPTIISTYGLKPNIHSLARIQNEVMLEDLFKD